MSERENWRHLGGAFYIVRTQAGLKHAIRHYAGGPTETAIKGYPRAYPALIVLATGYSGNTWIGVHAMPLNKVLAEITASEAQP